jgi:hypothetical protein
MDFLLLLPRRARVVIECDGIQHYADNHKLDNERRYANPRRYAEMVAEDRELRLKGYEVYRFAGAELTNDRAAPSPRSTLGPLVARSWQPTPPLAPYATVRGKSWEKSCPPQQHPLNPTSYAARRRN